MYFLLLFQNEIALELLDTGMIRQYMIEKHTFISYAKGVKKGRVSWKIFKFCFKLMASKTETLLHKFELKTFN